MNDCVVIGGGVVGLSLAYELSMRGRSVVVFDRAEMGTESSWAGAGILPPADSGAGRHPIEALRDLSNRMHEDWSKRLECETGIHDGYFQCGGLYVARSRGELAALRAWTVDLTETKRRWSLWDQREISAKEPALANVSGAIYLPDEAQVRNPRRVQALIRSCEINGVQLTPQAAVTEVALDSRSIEFVVAAGKRVTAKQYVFAAGAWTREILSRQGFSLGVLPIRGQIVLYRLPTRPLSAVVNEGPRYVVSRLDGRVLVGSTEEEAGFEKKTTEDEINRLRQFAEELVPQLASAEIEKTWAGLRPATLDGFPYIGKIPGIDNGFVSTGHFRSGVQLSTGSARVLAQLMSNEACDVDLTPFRIGRG